MMPSDCLFCRIVSGEIPADVVLSTDDALAIRDTNPQAPAHVLVLPRDHYDNVDALAVGDPELLGRLLVLASQVAGSAGLASTGHRLVINTGVDGGQTIGHLHIHVLGGRSLSWPPG